jgi:methylmalonyl-CoA mutase N-terminal domain/subunit
VDESVEAEQVARLVELRKTRNNDAVTRALDALKRGAAAADENLVPLIYEAVKAEASLGEISDALRAVFGVHREHVVL